jgi:NAD(P)-dependent dehydrogenase (short-subunit alcohol dehydrogenase family)
MANNNSSGRVHGKRVLITGAARGMGRSHAVRLAEEGADLVLVDICAPIPGLDYPLSTKADLEETARLVREHQRTALTHVADVRDAEAMKAVVDEAVSERGGLDAAVANAGVLTTGTWDATTTEQWRLVLDVNLIGAWNTCAAVIPHLLARGGSLVNISSSAGIKGTPLHVPYTASKHGIVGMSLALANELAAQNIRVNTVHPTGVATGMAPPSMHEQIAGRPDLCTDFRQCVAGAAHRAVGCK